MLGPGARRRVLAAAWVRGAEPAPAQPRPPPRPSCCSGAGAYIMEIMSVMSIQGFINFTFRDRHWSEYLVWALVLVGASAGATALCLSTWHRYQTSPVVLSLERNYLDWPYETPAVFACRSRIVDPERVNATAYELAGDRGEEEVARMADFLTAVANSSSYHSLEWLAAFADRPKPEPLPAGSLLDLFHKVRDLQPVAERVPAVEVMTEVGLCWALNSLVGNVSAVDPAVRAAAYAHPPNPNRPVSFFETSIEVVAHTFASSYEGYVTPPEGLPDLKGPTVRVLEDTSDIVTFETSSIQAAAAVRKLRLSQRKCRYKDELVAGSPRPVYSLAACQELCRARMAQALCGCRPYFVNISGIRECDIAGSKCLYENVETLVRLKDRSGKRKDLPRCDCLPLCSLTTYRKLMEKKTYTAKELATFVNDRLVVRGTVYAKTRLKRDVLFTITDLAVSFGGAVGLFLGASVISAIEIAYFFSLRLLVDLCRQWGRSRSRSRSRAKAAP